MTKQHRLRIATVVALSLALTVMLALAAGPAVAKKKKKSKPGGTVDITKQAALSIPPATATTPGFVQSTIDVGKQAAGMRIRDVNPTVQITGTGTNSINELLVKLTAPNGASTILFGSADFGNLLGPLTLDDESPLALQDQLPPALDPLYLYLPWQGTAQPQGVLNQMDNGPAQGTWTASVFDFDSTAHTNTLVFWRLMVVTGRPYRTK